MTLFATPSLDGVLKRSMTRVSEERQDAFILSLFFIIHKKNKGCHNGQPQLKERGTFMNKIIIGKKKTKNLL